MKIRSMTLALGLLALPATAAAQDYPEVNLRFAHFLTPNFPGAQVDQWFADEIAKRSDGNIQIEIFYAGALGKPTELLDLVRSGAIELAAIGTSYYPNELPLAGIVQAVPNVYESNEEAVRITEHLFEISEPLKEELDANNVHPVFWHSLAGYRPLCTAPIETVADFEGRKMRAWGEYVPQMWAALDATPVNVLPAELYESLQRGTLDCVFWAPDLLYAGKLYEVAKYLTDIHFGAFVNYPVMVNADLWESWPQSVRDLFETVGREATERDIALVLEAGERAIAEMTGEHGVSIVTFEETDALDERLPDLAATWASDMEARGVGDEARRLIEELRAMQNR